VKARHAPRAWLRIAGDDRERQAPGLAAMRGAHRTRSFAPAHPDDSENAENKLKLEHDPIQSNRIMF